MNKFNSAFIIVLLVLTLIFSCSDPSSSNSENLTIAWTSVQSGDSLNQGGGVVIRFSAPLDLNSFNAQAIEQTYEIMYMDSTGPKTVTVNMQVFKIEAAGNILANGDPLTLWYNPSTYEIALFEETTIQMPSGTGEGFIIDQDSTELIIKAGLKAQNGGQQAEDYRLIIYRASGPHRLRVIPNPAYPAVSMHGAGYPMVNFTHLPDSCLINVYDHTGTMAASLQHQGGGSERWDLMHINYTYIEPGIYRYELNENSDIVKGGVFLFPVYE